MSFFFFFSSRRRHTRCSRDWSSDVCSSDLLAETAGHWNVMRIEREVVDRARSPFPGEPIRTLDALHLASAVVARAAVADLAFLSLDEKGRASGRALGLRVMPA